MRITIILFTLFNFISFAQKKEVKGYVYYGEYQNLFMGRKGGREIRGTLVFDKNQSFYRTGKDSLNTAYQKEIDLANTNAKLEKIDDRIIYSSESISEDEIRDHIKYSIHTKKDSIESVFEYGSEKYGDYHYLREPKANMNWKLEKESKKIGDFSCFKATCHFRGRDYIAWYTPSIPVPYGPWKLQGLPGLIIEVYTPNQEIYFYAKKIVYPLEINLPLRKINKPKDEEWMTSIEQLLKRQDDVLQETYDHVTLVIASINSSAKAVRTYSKNSFKEFEE